MKFVQMSAFLFLSLFLLLLLTPPTSFNNVNLMSIFGM